MNALAVALIAFVCLTGGALLGMVLRHHLAGHLSEDSQKLLGMGLGVIGTMSGLVLGLLVASATGAYNAQQSELLDVSSKVVILDHVLKRYGRESSASRRALRGAVTRTLARIWPEQRTNVPQLDPSSVGAEAVLDGLEDLTPKTDVQRSLKAEAIGLAIDLGEVRWLMYEQTGSSLSTALLVVLIFWFTITFIGFGLFAPPNATVIVALGLCALAVSAAIFVTLEMYTPFEGIVQLSSAPLRAALMHMGQ